MRRGFWIGAPIALLFSLWVWAAQPRTVAPTREAQLEDAQWSAYWSSLAYQRSVRNGAPPAEQAALQRRAAETAETVRLLLREGIPSRLHVDARTGELRYRPGMSPDERAR